MAWQGRSDLEKQMRKANDRLRALEAHRDTSVPAYKEAMRLIRNATGNPTDRAPRFRRSDFNSEKELRKALKKFTDAKTSTVTGVNKMVKAQQAAYSKSAGRQISAAEAKAIGNIWEGIRKSHAKYEASSDEVTQKLIEKGLEKGYDEDAIIEVLNELRDESVPIDEWEDLFDQNFEDWDEADDEGDIEEDLDEEDFDDND